MRLFFAVLFLSLTLSGAPFPTTGSSIVNSPKWNTAFSQMGFAFKLVSNEWVYLENPSQKQQSSQSQIDMGLKTLSESARLSLKTEMYKSKINLESYAKKYLRDYNQYGFEVISSKTIMLNNNPAIVIDLVQKNKSTQSRQFFISAGNKITVASCIDKTDVFTLTSNMCQQLFNTYQWRTE